MGFFTAIAGAAKWLWWAVFTAEQNITIWHATVGAFKWLMWALTTLV